MASATNQSDEEAKIARKLNEMLAEQVARWKRGRLAWTIALAAAGIGALFFKPVILLAPPCFIGAFIMLLLYLDARDQLREVKSRRCVSATPRVSRLTSSGDTKPTDAPAGP
ncbi:MAG: hypothetical protein HYS13_22370 [Planctomycetia bacterium]|nr:hypothetical protein [Planctomycetia bacterium]